MAAVPGPVSLHRHWGHSPLLGALARARTTGSIPSALLIHGPKGVGKQHLALWLGRLLLCRSPGSEGPCEACQDCRLASKLEHPDLHWYFPLSRPEKAATPEKLAEALEEARGERLKTIREDPLHVFPWDEARALYLAAARSLRRQAQKPPSMGARQVFIIADAEKLAPQESSSEAANALLKLLEEPPSGTILILTSSEPGRLLPTIRSRTTQLHLPQIPLEEVTGFLVQVAGVPEEEARRLGSLSQGSIGRALGFRTNGGERGSPTQVRKQAFDLLCAALGPTPAPIFQKPLDFPGHGARKLMELLDFMEEGLRDLALVASGAPGDPWNTEEGALLRNALGPRPIHPPAVADAVRRVEEARILAAGNVNPQLLIFALLRGLRHDLLGPRDRFPPGM